MKKSLGLAITAILVTGGWFGYNQLSVGKQQNSYSYVTKTASLGEIRNTVSATGTLSAVDDVIIGTQLSGQISEIFVDFNDKVVSNQLLAQIDPRTFKAKVDQAKAQVSKTEADIEIQKIAISRAKVVYEHAQTEYQRGVDLVKKKFLSPTDFETLKTDAELANFDYQNQQAQLKALNATLAADKASLAQAQIDLDYTEIRSPIDGFVINRTIEKGQTVASSLSTPELFTVAKDLSLMEIEAYIDESDIGPILTGQVVDFTVDAFPDKKFKGEVKQIRQAPQDNSGVISYQVIISANNPDNLFLPGMTSNLEINIDLVRDVQRIENSALRVAQKLSPTNQQNGIAQLESLNLTDEQKLALKEKMPRPDKSAQGMAGPGMGGMGERPSNADSQKQKMLAILSEILTEEQLTHYQAIVDGKIKVGQLMVLAKNNPETINIQYGINDTQYTQIMSPDITGMQIITQVKENK